MIEQTPPPRESLRVGHEPRDLSIPLIVVAAIVVALGLIVTAIALWQLSLFVVPEQKPAGASPPTEMPGEPPVNDRLKAVPPPRLEPLEPLQAQPASYRSSQPLPGSAHTQRPEDLRADRQPALNSYGWVEKGKVARIPIDRAMDAIVDRERTKSAKKGGGK